MCVVPGCGTRHNLEIDHDDPWALTKDTSLANLRRLCRHHHRQKTHDGYALTGPPGYWQWHPPGGAPGGQPPERSDSASETLALSPWPALLSVSSPEPARSR